MMKPEQFYTPDDQPARDRKKRMWREIEKRIIPRRATLFFIADVRSFTYGMAAAILLYLAGVGSLSVVRQLIESRQPPVVKVDNAYLTAISEFERVLPAVATATETTPWLAGELESRKEQMRLLDAAISDLRKQTDGVDLSPLKRERLRQLYSMKLQILQQMIERGEIEL